MVSVDEVINANTRTAKVRIKLNESHESIRPESYVNVSIMAPLGKHLTVPVDALMDTGRETYVFISKGEGRFEPRAVAPIRETEDYIALASGVKEGESVVVGGNFMLDSESRLKAVIKGMASGQTHNH